MFGLPLHPLVVHIPMALAVLVPLVALAVLLSWWKGWLPQRAWWMVVALQAALVIGGFVALQTGENEEHAVESIVGEAPLETHEEAAELFEVTAAGVLVLMLAAGLIRREGARRAAAGVATAGTIAVAVLGAQVGHAGGKLVYQHGAANAYVKPASTALPAPLVAESEDD